MADDSNERPEQIGTQDQLGGGIGSRPGSVGGTRIVEANPEGNREERRMAAKLARRK